MMISGDAPSSFVADMRLAWAAGFCDGEGCIHIARQAPTGRRRELFRLRLHISQNCPLTLRKFQEVVGGRGRLYETAPQPNQRRQCYTLNFDGREAHEVISLLRPHLVRKLDEARLAYEFWVDGMAARKFGPRGAPEHVREIRRALYLRMQAVK